MTETERDLKFAIIFSSFSISLFPVNNDFFDVNHSGLLLLNQENVT